MDFLTNQRLRILLVTNGLIMLSSAMLGPVYAFFVEDVGGSFLDAGIAGAALSITAALVTFISGKYSDRVKENEYFIVAGYFIMAVGFYSFLLVNDVGGLVLVQIVIGLGSAIYAPAFDGLYSRYLDKGKEASEWGMWETLANFTIGIGALLGGVLVENFGFDVIFLIMGTLSLFSAAYIFLLPRKTL